MELKFCAKALLETSALISSASIHKIFHHKHESQQLRKPIQYSTCYLSGADLLSNKRVDLFCSTRHFALYLVASVAMETRQALTSTRAAGLALRQCRGCLRQGGTLRVAALAKVATRGLGRIMGRRWELDSIMACTRFKFDLSHVKYICQRSPCIINADIWRIEIPTRQI